MDSDGCLRVPVPTIKYSNLNDYEKIPTCKACSCGVLRNPHHQLNATEYLYTRDPWRKGLARIKEIISSEILYRVHCNLEKI